MSVIIPQWLAGCGMRHTGVSNCKFDLQWVDGCQAAPTRLRWLSLSNRGDRHGNPSSFDDLKSMLCRRIDSLPDHRKQGPNTRYSIQDAALSAFGIFFTQSPSFLEYQRHLQQTKGQNNASTLLGVETIPSNNQIRNLLDPIRPSFLDAVYLEVFEGLEQQGALTRFRVLSDQLLLALDGTQYFSSKTIHCPNCLRRQTAPGHILHSHSAITPVIVCPGRSEVIALPPEFITPQDGHDKQDCERVAGKRWIDKHAKHVAPYGVTLLGDDLYSNQPLCKLALQNGFNFLFVCKPDSHATLYARLAFWQDNEAIKELTTRQRQGRFTEINVSVPQRCLSARWPGCLGRELARDDGGQCQNR